MFKAIQAQREFKRQTKQSVQDFAANIGMDIEDIDKWQPDIVPAPAIEVLQAEGLSRAAAEAFLFMWDYLNSQEHQADMKQAIDRKGTSHAHYAQCLKRLEMMPGFLWQYKAVMDAIKERKIPDPDPARVKREIPRLIRQAIGGNVADFFQARNVSINVASGMAEF